MKMTVEIHDALLEETQRLASASVTTVEALVVSGLRRELTERQRGAKFLLRDASFGGRGLQQEVTEGGSERSRDLAYFGRGA